jgi:hypothetical protein
LILLLRLRLVRRRHAWGRRICARRSLPLLLHLELALLHFLQQLLRRFYALIGSGLLLLFGVG